MSTLLIMGFILVIREVMHHYERRDLYNRIMARNLNEYQNKREPLPARKNFVLEGIKRGQRELHGQDE